MKLTLPIHRRGAENAKEAQRGKLKTLQRLCETSAELCASAVEKVWQFYFQTIPKSIEQGSGR